MGEPRCTMLRYANPRYSHGAKSDGFLILASFVATLQEGVRAYAHTGHQSAVRLPRRYNAGTRDGAGAAGQQAQTGGQLAHKKGIWSWHVMPERPPSSAAMEALKNSTCRTQHGS